MCWHAPRSATPTFCVSRIDQEIEEYVGRERLVGAIDATQLASLRAGRGRMRTHVERIYGGEWEAASFNDYWFKRP